MMETTKAIMIIRNMTPNRFLKTWKRSTLFRKRKLTGNPATLRITRRRARPDIGSIVVNPWNRMSMNRTLSRTFPNRINRPNILIPYSTMYQEKMKDIHVSFMPNIISIKPACIMELRPKKIRTLNSVAVNTIPRRVNTNKAYRHEIEDDAKPGPRISKNSHQNIRTTCTVMRNNTSKFNA